MGPFGAADLGFAAWLIVASATLVFMVRRGHNANRWALVSFIAGPLSIPLAAWARYRAGAVVAKVSAWGRSGPGPLNVVVGVDGSSAAHDALIGAVLAFGERIGRLTLAMVIDFESAAPKEPTASRLEAEAILSREAAVVERLSGIQPRTMVLAGAGATALIDQAHRSAEDWIVVGAKGEGDADFLRGSVAEALINHPSASVMIIAGAAKSDGESTATARGTDRAHPGTHRTPPSSTHDDAPA